MDKRIKRIKDMENALDRALKAVGALEEALEGYRAAADDISLLEGYLNSSERMRDLEADESGLLPEGLRRGVLSQDGIWDLLERNSELRKKLAEFDKQV